MTDRGELPEPNPICAPPVVPVFPVKTGKLTGDAAEAGPDEGHGSVDGQNLTWPQFSKPAHFRNRSQWAPGVLDEGWPGKRSWSISQNVVAAPTLFECAEWLDSRGLPPRIQGHRDAARAASQRRSWTRRYIFSGLLSPGSAWQCQLTLRNSFSAGTSVGPLRHGASRPFCSMIHRRSLTGM